MEQKAEYQLSTSVHEGIPEIVITGDVAADAIEKLNAEVIAILRKLNAKAVLIDVRALTGRPRHAETYFRVRNLDPDILGVKIAVVDIPENADHESFQETAAVNAGLSWKWFTEIDAARTWLKVGHREGFGSARDKA